MNEKQLETAARRLCELRGVDPDAQVAHGADPNPDGTVYAVVWYSPAWTRAIREIRHQLQINEAIAAAQKEKS